MVYDKVTTQLLETIAPSGAKQTRTYEPYDPAKGQWGRSTSVTDASGRTTTSTFAAADAVATDCQGIQLAQEGAQQSVTLAGGSTISQVVAPGGGAVKTTDGTTTTCGSTLPKDVGTASTTTGVGPEVTNTNTQYVNGNPLVLSSSTTSQGRTDTTISRLDSNGDLWETTDNFGTKTVVQSDPFSGLVTRKTETTAAGETRTIDYTYAPNQAVATITVNGRLLLTNEYAADGRQLRTVLANGAVQTFELDANNNGKKIETTFPDGTVISETAVRSASGRLLSRTLSGPTGTSTYTYRYNVDGRLVHTTLTGTIPTTATEWHSQYDGPTGLNGDRASKTTTLADGTKQTIAFTYGPDNRPLTVSDGRLKGDIAYDAAGRATRVGGVDLAYDATGQLLSAADGSRSYTITDGGNTTTLRRTLPDGTTSVVSVSASGDTLMLGPDKKIEGQLVNLDSGINVVLDKSGAPARWLYEDMLGNTTWRSTGNAAPQRTHLYAPFGEPISVQRGTTPATPIDLVVNSLGWASGRGARTYRLAAPLMSIGARLYTPDAGRWLAPDPSLNGSFNAYEYAIGDPINMSDPSGNSPSGALLGLIASVVIGVVIGVFTFGIGTAVTTAGLAAVAVQVAVAAVIGAISGAVGDIVQQSSDKGWSNIDWAQVGIAAGTGAWMGAATAGVGAWVTKVLPIGFVARKLVYNSVEEFNKTGYFTGTVKVLFGIRFQQAAAAYRNTVAQQGKVPSLLREAFTTKGFFNPWYVKGLRDAQRKRAGVRMSDNPFDLRSGSISGPIGNTSARPTTVNGAGLVQGNRSSIISIESTRGPLQKVIKINNVPNDDYAVRNTILMDDVEALFSKDALRASLGAESKPIPKAFQDFIMAQMRSSKNSVDSFLLPS
jgi:RHS repeat-associated protein